MLKDYFVCGACIGIYENYQTWLQAVILQTVCCFYGSTEYGTRLQQKAKSYIYIYPTKPTPFNDSLSSIYFLWIMLSKTLFPYPLTYCHSLLVPLWFNDKWRYRQRRSEHFNNFNKSENRSVSWKLQRQNYAWLRHNFHLSIVTTFSCPGRIQGLVFLTFNSVRSTLIPLPVQGSTKLWACTTTWCPLTFGNPIDRL